MLEEIMLASDHSLGLRWFIFSNFDNTDVAL